MVKLLVGNPRDCAYSSEKISEGLALTELPLVQEYSPVNSMPPPSTTNENHGVAVNSYLSDASMGDQMFEVDSTMDVMRLSVVKRCKNTPADTVVKSVRCY